MYVRIHGRGSETLLAACDREIIGKTFNEGDLTLEVSEGFYRGDAADLSELEDLVKKASIVNLTGTRVVDEAVDKGLINKGNILTIEGIKHAQIIEI